MSLIPESRKREWRRSAHKRDSLDLNNLLDFRDLLEENAVNGLPRHPIGELYAEAAEAMGYAKNTLERKIREIREYPADKLQGWLNDGLSFDHIEKANDYQNYPPAELLDKAVELGAKEGDKPMTVEEMITLANGGKSPKETSARVTKAFGYLRKVPYWLGLSDEWTDEFLSDIDALWSKWQKRISQ